MADGDRWTVLATFPTILEAEVARATLETAGIPSLLQSHGGSGVFGPGFQGAVTGGATVLVAATDLEEAWTLVVEHG